MLKTGTLEIGGLFDADFKIPLTIQNTHPDLDGERIGHYAGETEDGQNAFIVCDQDGKELSADGQPAYVLMPKLPLISEC